MAGLPRTAAIRMLGKYSFPGRETLPAARPVPTRFSLSENQAMAQQTRCTRSSFGRSPLQWFFSCACLLLLAGLAGATTLAWDPQSDPSVTGYLLYYGTSSGNYSTKLDVGSVNSRVVSGLAEGTTYYYAVTAHNAAMVESGFSNEVSATVPFGAPVAAFSASTTTGVAPLAMNFTNSSTGNITAYAWTFGDGTTSTSQNPAHVYSVAGTYTISLTATGPGGSNTQTRSGYVAVTSAGNVDSTPPTIPPSLKATAASSTSVNVTWGASTDNVGVANYLIERCAGVGCTNFGARATVAGLTLLDTGMVTGTSYSYRIRAADTSGNLSGFSSVSTATPGSIDTTAPTAPAKLYASSVRSSRLTLSWVKSTDNVAVKAYLIERCQGSACTNFAQIATATSPNCRNGGLSAGTIYRYRVRAVDAAGNRSGYSNEVSVTAL
jgi:PKD repeat protein